MRLISISLAVAALLAIPSSTMAEQSAVDRDLVHVDALLPPCQTAARVALAGDAGFLDRYIRLAALPEDQAFVQRALCQAYLQGAYDMAEGRIVPLDVN